MEPVSDYYANSEDNWVALPAGTTVEWFKRKRATREDMRAEVGFEDHVVAVQPETGRLLMANGLRLNLAMPSCTGALSTQPTQYVPAPPGWFKLNACDCDDHEGWEFTWRPVIVWLVPSDGVESGIATDWNDDGIEYPDNYEVDPLYWHVGEGEERRAELQQQAVVRAERRKALEAELAAAQAKAQKAAQETAG